MLCPIASSQWLNTKLSDGRGLGDGIHSAYLVEVAASINSKVPIWGDRRDPGWPCNLPVLFRGFPGKAIPRAASFLM